MFSYATIRACRALCKRRVIIKAVTNPEKYLAISQKVLIESAVVGLDFSAFTILGILGIISGCLIPATIEDSYLKGVAGI